MATRKGQSSLAVLALVVIAAIAFGPQIQSAVSGGDAAEGLIETCEQNGIPAELCGSAADHVLSTTDEGDSANSLAADAKIYNGDGAFVTSVAVPGTGTATNSDLVAGERTTVHAYNGTSACNPVRDKLLDRGVVRSTLPCYALMSASDATVTFFDENGATTSSVTIGSGGQAQLDGIKVENDAEGDDYWNPRVIAFNTSDVSNLRSNDAITMTNAEEIDVPDHLGSEYTEAFVVYDAGDYLQGETPLLGDFESATSDGVQIFAADGQNPSGDLNVTVLDYHPYQAGDGSTEIGVEDDSPSNIGVGHVSTDLTIN